MSTELFLFLLWIFDLRKPTLLITTAPFLIPFSKISMTWERRMELKRLQCMKGVKMVRKYRDRQGKLRVVPLRNSNMHLCFKTFNLAP